MSVSDRGLHWAAAGLGHACLAWLSAGLAQAAPAGAGEWTVAREAVISPADATPDGAVGFSVAVNGETALLGSCYLGPEEPAKSGSAYVCKRSKGAWSQVQRLAPEVPRGLRSYGGVVALDGDLAAVGACGHLSFIMENFVDEPARKGAVYVYRRSGDRWTQKAKLEAADGRPGDRFGAAIVARGDVIAVGAPGRLSWLYKEARDRGAAYVFERKGDGWAQVARLAPPDLEDQEEFGGVVALAGDTLAVGSRKKVRVFGRSGGKWDFRGWLRPEEGRRLLADAIAVSGDRILAIEEAANAAPAEEQSGRTLAEFVVSEGALSRRAGPAGGVTVKEGLGGAFAVDLSGELAAVAVEEPGGMPEMAILARSGAAWSQVKRLGRADITDKEFLPMAFDLDGDTLALGGAVLGEREEDVRSVVAMFRIRR